MVVVAVGDGSGSQSTVELVQSTDAARHAEKGASGSSAGGVRIEVRVVSECGASVWSATADAAG